MFKEEYDDPADLRTVCYFLLSLLFLIIFLLCAYWSVRTIQERDRERDRELYTPIEWQLYREAEKEQMD